MPCDYKIYPKNWKTEIVPSILRRAGEIRRNGEIITDAKCEFCNVENHSLTSQGKKIVLTVAHLDHDPENHNVNHDRLKALCQKCHNKYDAPNRAINRKKSLKKKKKIKELFDEYFEHQDEDFYEDYAYENLGD